MFLMNVSVRMLGGCGSVMRLFVVFCGAIRDVEQTRHSWRLLLSGRKGAGDEFAGMGCRRGDSRRVGAAQKQWARISNVLQYFRNSTGA